MAYGIVNMGANLDRRLGIFGVVNDVNEAEEPGIYQVSSSTKGMPEDVSNHDGITGTLLVMPGPNGEHPAAWSTQILTGMVLDGTESTYQYYRIFCDVHASWNSWQKVPIINDNGSSQYDVWSAQKISSNLTSISQSLANMGQGLSGELSAVGGRVDDLQHQITSIGQRVETGLLDAVTHRGNITASKLSDLNITQSGIYKVSISTSFSIDGSTDIQEGGGLLVVFSRDDHSALQLWLKLDWNHRNDNCRLYWRFLQAEGDEGEGYVLPGTKFVSV